MFIMTLQKKILYIKFPNLIDWESFLHRIAMMSGFHDYEWLFYEIDLTI